MNEELRIQRVEQYGSFLYCPVRDTLCFGRYTDSECKYDSCILDDPEYQKLQERISRNRMQRNETKPDASEKTGPTQEQLAWREVYRKEAIARSLYKKNKPKLADGILAEAMYLRGQLNAERGKKP